MSNHDDDNLVRVVENGWDGRKYEYCLDVMNEPATVIVTLCPQEKSSVNDSCGDQNVNLDCYKTQGSKRQRLDKVSNQHWAYCSRSENESFCTDGSDVKGEEIAHAENDEDELSFELSEKNPQQIDRPCYNDAADNWTHDIDNLPDLPVFSGEPGLHVNRQEDHSVLSCFRLFFTDWLLKHLQEQTNKYANDLKASKTDELDRDGKSMLKDWKPVSLTDIKGFILILIHMGVVKKKHVDDYWCDEVFIASPFSNQILTRDRFRAILYMLHMNDNHRYVPISHPDHDPLHKIRPVYNHLQERFQRVYTPNQNLAIDETTHFSSSSNEPSYCDFQLLNQANDSSFRLYKLCECQSGYVYKFKLLPSPLESTDGRKSNSNIINDPTKVTLRLMSQLLNKGYHVYTDTNVTSPALYKTLIDEGTMCTGAVSVKTEGIPLDLTKERLVMGQISFRRKERLHAVRWNPGNSGKTVDDICLLTSAHHPLETVTKKESGRSRIDVTALSKEQPGCVHDYNKVMSTVFDNRNQITEYIPLARHAMKWSKRVFIHLLITSIKQAMIVYNKLQNEREAKSLDFSLFVKALGKEMADDYIAGQSEPAKSFNIASLANKPTPLLRTDHTHFHHLTSLPMELSQMKKPRKVCRVCSDVFSRLKASTGHSVRCIRKTNFWCDVCKVALCIEPCFYIYHSEGDYVSAGAAMDHYLSMTADSSSSAADCSVDIKEEL